MRASVSIHHGQGDGPRYRAQCLLCLASFVYADADAENLSAWFADHFSRYHRMQPIATSALLGRVLSNRVLP